MAQLVQRRTGTLLTQVRPRMRQGIFLPESTFSENSLSVSVHPRGRSHALTYVHVKDPVVHIKGRGITETLKHPACTVGWVARLFRGWLSPEKATCLSSSVSRTKSLRSSNILSMLRGQTGKKIPTLFQNRTTLGFFFFFNFFPR